MTNTQELVTIAEIADWFGVPSTTVVNWRYRHKRRPRPPWQAFPDPIRYEGRSPLFDRTQVEAWGKTTGRLN